MKKQLKEAQDTIKNVGASVRGAMARLKFGEAVPVFALALTGYVYIFIFPLLLLLMVARLGEIFEIINWPAEWWWPMSQLLVLLIGGAGSFFVFKTRFAPPKGPALTAANAPALIDLIDELLAEYRAPAVHRVIASPDYKLELVKTPTLGFPVRFTHTLIIGLPVLQALPALHFKVVLARRIGQLSRRQAPISAWLYHLRGIWFQYRDLARAPGFGVHTVLWSPFRVIAPMYARLAGVAMRKYEMEGDAYALQVVNDEDVAEAIAQDMGAEAFIQQEYWPAIAQLAAKKREEANKPYTNMPSLMRKRLQDERMQKRLAGMFEQEAEAAADAPGLKERLLHIGHAELRLPAWSEDPAALTYLGATAGKLAGIFDMLWLKKAARRV